MVKNEEVELPVTLSSLEDRIGNPIDGILLLDTGSTDSTIQLVKDWGRSNFIEIKVAQRPFDDFSSSRNHMLDKAAELSLPWLLIIDAGDQLIFPDDSTPKLVKGGKGLKNDVYTCRKRWRTFDGDLDFTVKCLVRPDSAIRYVGPVHEILVRVGSVSRESDEQSIEIIVYQDRRTAGNSTALRLVRDLRVLLNARARDKENLQTYFLLGRTYASLRQFQESALAFEDFLKRLDAKCAAIKSQLSDWECNYISNYRYIAAVQLADMIMQKFALSQAFSPSNLLYQALKISGCPSVAAMLYEVTGKQISRTSCRKGFFDYHRMS